MMPHLVVLQVAGADAVVQPGELLGHAREVAGWAAASGVAEGAERPRPVQPDGVVRGVHGDDVGN